MRKLAIALVAAITVGAAVPAAAQVGFYAGPGGIGVGVGPGYYDYGPGYYGYGRCAVCAFAQRIKSRFLAIRSVDFRLSSCWDKYGIALSASQRGSRSPAFAALIM